MPMRRKPKPVKSLIPRSMPVPVVERLVQIGSAHAANLRDIVPRPVIGLDRILDLFVKDEEQRIALVHVSNWCKSKVPTVQSAKFKLKSSTVSTEWADGHGRMVTADYVFEYSVRGAKVFLPDTGEPSNTVWGDQHRGLFDMAQAYADNHLATELRAAMFTGLVRYLAVGCKTIAELKTVWPDLPSVFDAYAGSHPEQVERWLEKFRNAKSSAYVPNLFEGFRACIEDARSFVGAGLLAAEVQADEDSISGITVAVFRRKFQPLKAPWADDIPSIWITETEVSATLPVILA